MFNIHAMRVVVWMIILQNSEIRRSRTQNGSGWCPWDGHRHLAKGNLVGQKQPGAKLS